MRRSVAGQWVTGLICFLVFAALLGRFRAFVLDDSYITFRFAEHLAMGEGLVWNLGEDPVEGYTSLLWVIGNAVAIKCGLDPVWFSKALSSLSAFCVLGILGAACRRLSPAWTIVVLSGLALSPPFAFLTIQGMETAFSMLILLVVALLGIRACSRPTTLRLGSLCLMSLLAGLARPDNLAFSGGLILGLIVLYAFRRDPKSLLRLGAVGLAATVLGLLHMAWRVGYFGYLFPNTFYTKVGTEGGLFKATGVLYAGSFLLEILFPYLLLSWLLLRDGIRGADRKTYLRGIQSTGPVVLGCLFHGFYLLTLNPVQGFFWRYAFPILPILLLVLGRLLEQVPESNRLSKGWVPYSLAVLFAVWSLRFYPDANFNAQYRSQHVRVAVGRSLAGTYGTLYTTGAGAIPFYSRWKAVDNRGLVSEEVAHQGVSRELLASVDPDLVILRSSTPGDLNFGQPSFRVIESFLIDREYLAVAAIHRSYDYHLFLFVRPGGELFETLLQRLTNVPEVAYGDLHELMGDSEIPFYATSEKTE